MKLSLWLVRSKPVSDVQTISPRPRVPASSCQSQPTTYDYTRLWLLGMNAISSAGMLCAIAFPLTLVSISSSMAQETNCANPTTPQTLTLCAHQGVEASDKKLNLTYQQLLRQVTGEPRRLLINAQQAWIQYRNTTCAYEYDAYTGGSISSIVYTNCLRRLTERRIKDFENYLPPR